LFSWKTIIYGVRCGCKIQDAGLRGRHASAIVAAVRTALKTVICFVCLVCFVRFLLLPPSAFALGGHELLVLANGNSEVSLRVARKYVELRRIPAENLVVLPVPARLTESPRPVSHADFTRHIWEPAQKALAERGIADHVLAWAYSTDFPVAVSIHEGMSIQGITFLRNKAPRIPADVNRGNYGSPLFTGPDRPTAMGHFAQSLDMYRRWLGTTMPLPSMMLGYTGKLGNTEKEVIHALQMGKKADNTAPTGTVYFVTSSDIRSKCRQWQFWGAVKELTRLGVRARVTDDFPSGKEDVLGVMMGAANVKPRAAGSYLPGAMAEHLTSAAAVFTGSSQTKLTAWIRAGASASAGTVVEPRAIWTKFPSARFFVHYASGCTMMESFCQSIRCPLQVLLVGDPLAAPWMPAPELIVDGMEPGTEGATVLLRAEVKDERGHYGKFLYLLDGRIIGREPLMKLRAGEIPAGDHVLRVVAYRTGLVRTQVFVERSLTVRDGKVKLGS